MTHKLYELKNPLQGASIYDAGTSYLGTAELSEPGSEGAIATTDKDTDESWDMFIIIIIINLGCGRWARLDCEKKKVWVRFFKFSWVKK